MVTIAHNEATRGSLWAQAVLKDNLGAEGGYGSTNNAPETHQKPPCFLGAPAGPLSHSGLYWPEYHPPCHPNSLGKAGCSLGPVQLST